MTHFRELTDDEWTQIAPLFPELTGGQTGTRRQRGRPVANTRAVFNGLLWVMFTGSAWAALPVAYPPFTTCHRRYKAWDESGVLESVVIALSDSIGLELASLLGARRGPPADRVSARDGALMKDHLSVSLRYSEVTV